LGLFAGTAIYARYLRFVPFRNIFFWAQVSQAAFIFLDFVQVKRWNLVVGLPDFLFVVGGDVISEVFHRFKSMPFLVLSAQLCPPDIEATFFSLLMSISNISNDTANLIGASLLKWKGITTENFKGLDVLLLYKIIGTLVPLLFLWLVPNVSNIQREDGEEKKEEKVTVVEDQ
jgi:hypothetical protein